MLIKLRNYEKEYRKKLLIDKITNRALLIGTIIGLIAIYYELF